MLHLKVSELKLYKPYCDKFLRSYFIFSGHYVHTWRGKSFCEIWKATQNERVLVVNGGTKPQNQNNLVWRQTGDQTSLSSLLLYLSRCRPENVGSDNHGNMESHKYWVKKRKWLLKLLKNRGAITWCFPKLKFTHLLSSFHVLSRTRMLVNSKISNINAPSILF